MVELIELVFAVDSVPAILAIASDPFIVYTSNIFAIFGSAGFVLCPRRDDSPLQVPELRVGLGAGFHRHKNFAAISRRQNATSDFAWRDLWAD